METASELVSTYISNRQLPDDLSTFLEEFASTDRTSLETQESTLWDYKKEYPFSLSDDYFGGIVRLICGFYNTFGGLLIFGVDDTTRKITGNSVNINIERLNTVLRERLTTAIECTTRHYDHAGTRGVDLLLVPKRDVGAPPVRFSEPIGKYPRGIIYVRQNHEVLSARSSEMPFLYGPRIERSSGDRHDDPPDLIRALPASPATVKEFVGRSPVMDRLWHWLVYDDEPRSFLFGKGGSGKSTIAFEFAKTVALSAPYFTSSNGESLDAVLFLSAKGRSFDTNSGQIVPFVGRDFETAEELFRQIIVLSEWLDFRDVEYMSLEGMRKEVQELMDTITPLIVIDDIDTLTTHGRDPGMDALYGAALRAKKGGKILYTLRNAPTQSLAQAIEVPGLQNPEYREFIGACCKQFKQPEPSDGIIDGDLSASSERRPLVVEAVIGLRRTTGSYEKALELLNQRAGDEIRSYLFDREYNTLGSDNRARYVLAALSLSPKPLAFPDLEALTRYNAQQLSDALGEVREMFLNVVHNKKGETLYALGQSTRDYIAGRRERLDKFAQLRERLHNYLGQDSRQPREITRLEEEVHKQLFYYKDPKQALELLQGQRDKPKITEHPRYQALLGIVATKHKPPLLDQARDAFRFADDLGRMQVDAVRNWYYLEWTSGTGIQTAISICDKILQDDEYSARVKAEFYAKKGFALELKAKSLGNADPEGMVNCFAQSLDCNILAYNSVHNLTDMGIDKQRLWTSNCATGFAEVCIEHNQVQKFFKTVDEYAKKAFVCDPLERGVSSICYWASTRRDAPSMDRAIGLLSNFQKSFIRSQKPFLFLDPSLKRSLVSALDLTINGLKTAREKLRYRQL